MRPPLDLPPCLGYHSCPKSDFLPFGCTLPVARPPNTPYCPAGIPQPEKTPNYSPAEMQGMLQDLVGPAMVLPPSTGHQIAQQGQHGPPELVNPLLQAMQVRDMLLAAPAPGSLSHFP